MPTLGLPRDPAQWLALAIALVALAFAPRFLGSPRDSGRLLTRAVLMAAVAAALLSAAYIPVYLRGGPRIIDASAYYLEARAIAEGLLSFPLREPETSVLGRFLVRSDHVDGPHAAVIFPPGWPAILAIGFLIRAPMVVGPILAAAIVVATYDLAAQLAKRLDMPRSPWIPAIAAILSVVCAALRYHTADTMSHGLAALCFTASVTLAFRAADARAEGRGRRAIATAAASGLAAGWLFATRPPSAIALAITLAFVLIREGRRGFALPFAIATLPGVCLFLLHQRAATGALWVSSQRLYYALSDGPPGCFRYGFGAGVGCVGEHGDFVRARLSEGFGALAAAGTTLRRLKMHLVDPLNFEPLALLVPLGAYLTRASPRGRAIGLAVIAQIVAYVPFYFDGNYPAGGGRFFCDVLPFEHALAAAAIVAIAAKTRLPERFAAGAIAAAIAGFAFRAGFDHAQLRDRDGGRPLFTGADLASAGVTKGLVFVDTDHGFNLAYDPRPTGDLAFARFHGDALDRIAWETHGRPPAFRHRFMVPPGGGPGLSTVDPLPFPEAAPLLIEAESLWPPIAQDGGFALIEWASGSCASGSRWLALHAVDAAAPASITLGLPARALAGRTLSPRVATMPGARGELILHAGGAPIRSWNIIAPDTPGPSCLDLAPARVPAGSDHLRLTLTRAAGAAGAVLAVDRIAERQND